MGMQASMAGQERSSEALAKRRLIDEAQTGDRAAFDAYAALVVDRLFAVAI